MNQDNKKNAKIICIIPAAGESSRFNSSISYSRIYRMSIKPNSFLAFSSITFKPDCKFSILFI